MKVFLAAVAVLIVLSVIPQSEVEAGTSKTISVSCIVLPRLTVQMRPQSCTSPSIDLSTEAANANTGSRLLEQIGYEKKVSTSQGLKGGRVKVR